MSSEVGSIRLRELSSRITKGTTPTKGEGFSEYGVNYIKSESITADGSIDASKFAFVDPETHHKLARSQLRAGNVLFSMAGVYLGKTAVVLHEHLPANTNQAVGIVTLDESKADPYFIHYSLQSPACRAWVLRSAAQSAQPNFNLQEIGDLKIPAFPLARQKEIASVLRMLDDRITLLRETNATLEAIAQALFKSWFVDFDPVRAKMEGRVPAGMNEATAAMFPDGFEESDLGLVPREWRIQSLDTIAAFLNGLALQKFPPTGQDDLPVIKIAQLRKGDSVGADQSSRSIKPEYVVKNGDVLFSWSGSLEVEIWCGGEGALNQHLFKVTSESFPKWFYFFWTRHHLADFRQTAASKATTMGHIQRGHLTAAKVCIPTAAVIETATAVLGPIVESLIENSLQAQTLATLRDTLLPRLISGQLRLPEAEFQLEDSYP
jgi:type I restriction enzyme S subunit